MKVCLIVPPRSYLLNPRALPNLGVLYIASALQEHNCEVEIVDLAITSEIPEADIYGISATTPDFYDAINIANRLDGKVVIGGVHAMLMPHECATYFDTVAAGDEATVPKILYEKGIVTGFLRNIDTYHPDRSLVDLWNYEFYIDGERATSMLTARGCIWNRCAFCSRTGKPIKFHSVEYVEDEIVDILNYGFRAIMVYDDEFFVHPRRDAEIVKLFKEYDVIWRCFGRADFILKNKGLVELAAKSGLREVLIGVESADDRILQIIDKGTTVELNKKAIIFLHSLGVKVKAAMIVGLPGENEESLQRMWKFCEEVENYVADFDFSILVPYPGSKIWQNPENYDIEFEKKYIAYKTIPGQYNCAVRTSSLSHERLIEWRDKLEKRFKRRW